MMGRIGKKAGRCLGLIRANLHKEPGTWLEYPARLTADGGNRIQPVLPAVQGKARFVVAHLRLQKINISRRNIGGIADQQIKTGILGQGRKKIAALKMYACCYAMLASVPGSQLKGCA